jgi:hypothetical protein
VKFRAESRPRVLADGQWSILVLRISANKVAQPFEVCIAADGVRAVEKNVMDEAQKLQPDAGVSIGAAHAILDWMLPDFVERWCRQQPDTSVTAAINGNRDHLKISLRDVEKSFNEE